jgi:hypothetical protein
VQVQNLSLEKGRIKINLMVIPMGDDLCITITGGDKSHIGCVTLSIPRPGLADPGVTRATTSTLNITGHKDDEAARYVSHLLSSHLNKNVVVICGIHVNNITTEEIKITFDLLERLTDTVIKEHNG